MDTLQGETILDVVPGILILLNFIHLVERYFSTALDEGGGGGLVSYMLLLTAYSSLIGSLIISILIVMMILSLNGQVLYQMLLCLLTDMDAHLFGLSEETPICLFQVG